MSYSDNYSSSIELESAFSMFDSEMVGGSKYSLNDLKQITLLTTKMVANTTKKYHLKGFFKDFNKNNKFIKRYNKKINNILDGELMINLNNRTKIKKILSLNIKTFDDLSKLLKSNHLIISEFKLLEKVIDKLTNVNFTN